MLSTVVTKEIVTTRESFGVGAAVNFTVEGDLSRSLLHVLPLMTRQVFGVEEPLTASRASVRPLITTKVDLEVAIQLAIAVECFVAAIDIASKPVLAWCLPLGIRTW